MQPYINPNYYSYTQPMAPQPIQPTYQPAQQLARVVQDFNNITVGDIPTNGSPAFFIKSDYTEIQSRRWTDDGRITSSTYKLEAEAPKENRPDPFAAIMARLDAIEEKLPAKATPRKKEVAADE